MEYSGPYSNTPITASGGTNPLSFSISPALPSPLIFTTSTGRISGNTTVSFNTATFTITATDSSVPSQSESGTFTLSISSGPPIELSVDVPGSVLTKMLQLHLPQL